jgi:hypothetical protein
VNDLARPAFAKDDPTVDMIPCDDLRIELEKRWLLTSSLWFVETKQATSWFSFCWRNRAARSEEHPISRGRFA